MFRSTAWAHSGHLKSQMEHVSYLLPTWNVMYNRKQSQMSFPENCTAWVRKSKTKISTPFITVLDILHSLVKRLHIFLLLHLPHFTKCHLCATSLWQHHSQLLQHCPAMPYTFSKLLSSARGKKGKLRHFIQFLSIGAKSSRKYTFFNISTSH